MATAGFKVEGLNQVVRALQQMGLDVEDLKDTFSKIADRGAEAVARHVPVKSGRARGDVRGNRAKSKAVVTAGRSSLPYIAPLNYGWPARNIEAAGFMQAGDEEMQPIAVQLLEDGINDKIREKHFR